MKEIADASMQATESTVDVTPPQAATKKMAGMADGMAVWQRMAEWQEWQNGRMVEWRNGKIAYGMAEWRPNGRMVEWQEWQPNGGMVEWQRWQNGGRNGQISAEWSNGGNGHSNGGNVYLPTILWYTPTTTPTTTPTPFNLL